MCPVNASAPVIRARDVRRTFGRTVALDGATCEISAGVTGLLGPNGAGKTTLIGLVLGLHPPDGGSLEVLGMPVREAGPRVRQRIGYSPEHDAMPPDVRAQDLVRHIAELHGLRRRDAIERASSTLALVGLGEERFRPIGTLSTGQRQRVKIAQAIAHDPDLVLLDEPTDGLDPLQRDEMLALIRRVGHELGLDVIISSHLLDEVQRVCDAVVVLREGRVTATRRLAERRPGEEVLVEVDGDADALADRLRERGVGVGRGSTPATLVVGGGDEALDVLRDVLAETGVGLRRLQPRATSLADLLAGTAADG